MRDNRIKAEKVGDDLPEVKLTDAELAQMSPPELRMLIKQLSVRKDAAYIARIKLAIAEARQRERREG